MFVLRYRRGLWGWVQNGVPSYGEYILIYMAISHMHIPYTGNIIHPNSCLLLFWALVFT